MKSYYFTFFFLLIFTFLEAQTAGIYIRTNLIGYHKEDSKVAFILSDKALRKKIKLVDKQSSKIVFKGKPKATKNKKWGKFKYQYLFDFSKFKKAGTYSIEIEGRKETEGRKEMEGRIAIRPNRPNRPISKEITIHETGYENYQKDLLAFMRQQRCGYNPYFDIVCHQGDGRIFYAPVPDSTYYDFSGGWHDAGDQLKYLITSSNATARMLKAYELAPNRFGDIVDKNGHPYPNGIPDVLDEAKWGLDWLLKLHPKADWLIHQIADDRDHIGFKYPDKDPADYGWGPNSYRVAYFANGQPQGLGKWKSKATGVANLAGRTAAALALGARIWKKLDIDAAFAQKCQKAAIELYRLGKEQEGYQQGNSYGAPYRYNEDSWADDMEWGAAELYQLTNQADYLEDAIHYASLIKDAGWMAQDSMAHYQKYPFMNMGHFALYESAPAEVKKSLAKWYQQNIEKVITRAETNAFQVGVPFLWCSNNLMVNFITQVLLYERMTGDKQYHAAMLLHRDWLFGRNPWGTSMFTGIPRDGETPLDVHIPPRALLKDTPAGGLVDGPIYKTIHQKLLGLVLHEPDEFAAFQNDFVVYQDDIGDYSTNEPTMDGTADAILMMALWSRGY
jgi:hypothetical protein